MEIEDASPLASGKVFIISAPAGTGKTTLVNRLKQELNYVRETVSCTTRSPRDNEVHGVDYFFMRQEEFQLALQENAFLEWVELYNCYYGTLRHQVEELKNEGYHVLLVIDTQGAMRIRKELEATLIFISPPSMDELRRRLYWRGTETREVIERRLSWAEHEMKQSHLYDYNIINDNLEQAYATLKNIIQKEGRLS
jgi:guanylate kinase